MVQTEEKKRHAEEKGYQGVSAARQVWVLAEKEVQAGFRSKLYRICALLGIALVFAVSLFGPTLLGGFSGGEKTVAVVGGDKDRQALLAMPTLPQNMKYEAMDGPPAAWGKYGLIVDVSAFPVTMKAENVSALVHFQGLVPVVELYQREKQLQGAGAVPPVPVGISYDNDDSEATVNAVMSYAISVIMLFAVVGFSGVVMQGVFADKNSRLADVLYPKASAFRILAGKILGIGIFGWLQLLFLAILIMVSAELFTEFDWQKLLLPPTIAGLVWFVFGYLFIAFIAAALGSLVRNAQVLSLFVTPLYLLGFASYGSGMLAAADMSAPWVWWLGLFPPFSMTLVPMQAAAGGATVGYLLVAALVSGLCVAACAVASAQIYRRCIVGKPTRA